MSMAFITAADAALVLNYGTANQHVVAGLKSLGLPVGSRLEITISQFGYDFDTKISGGGTWSNITAAGQLAKGDTKGQSFLRLAMKNRTKLYDETRIYLDQAADDFVTLDLATQPDGYFQVIKAGDGSATDKNSVFPFSVEMICGGAVAYFFTHHTASLAFVAGSSGVKDTITDAASGFVTAGFEVGQTIIIEGSTGNDGQHLITAVAAGTLTLDGEGELTSHSAESVTLHAGTI